MIQSNADIVQIFTVQYQPTLKMPVIMHLRESSYTQSVLLYFLTSASYGDCLEVKKE